jgi:hypothetical protein
MRQRTPRLENEKHLRFVASLPCLFCKKPDVQAAHVRFADLTIAKPFTGGATKPDDRFTVPLCIEHHRLQHEAGERDFWGTVDPVKIALAIYSVTGDHSRAEQIVYAVS